MSIVVLGPQAARLPASRATLIENADLFQGVDATELVTFDAGRRPSIMSQKKSERLVGSSVARSYHN